ncbi:MAG: nucleotidyltransferase family protein [archaeon]
MNKKVEELKKKIIPILKKNGVIKAGIFGSYVRGNSNKKSDVDLLVEFKKKPGLFDFIGIKIELEEKIGKKVDLLTYDSIYPMLRERILTEEVRII